ncbi:hypothetical protein K466DRAFT_507711 [Polyporus arcularius HHB13444]|uniref:CxC2-like cysteine cluster KDZ transposase-associated domain-containing protein n=1 Tax=Polyporus arcularius HHB13444 TaxID=1314778 RepID=A0A5C3NPC4_9APHY|nr:hypothetical protein K466DRAFT_507711 [Polyporus arcularius HHB13444]
MRHVNEYLAELLCLEGRGKHRDGTCPRCKIPASAAYRCDDCSDCALYCADCIKALHSSQPLHRVQMWNARGFFERVTLKSLGLRIQLGHESGDRCFNPKRAFADDFVVIDITGIHEVAVDFCNCHTALAHATQLLRARWYPATYTDPKTAATFRLMEHFHVLSTQSKVSGWEFYVSLVRRTENTGTTRVKVRDISNP